MLDFFTQFGIYLVILLPVYFVIYFIYKRNRQLSRKALEQQAYSIENQEKAMKLASEMLSEQKQTNALLQKLIDQG